DLIAAAGCTSVYFVDDNFIGNQKAALELLPHLVAWQERHRYPLRFACEATLNIAKNERVLALMREAGFITVCGGIETPDLAPPRDGGATGARGGARVQRRLPAALRDGDRHVATLHHGRLPA